MRNVVHAPWSEAQVHTLNLFQAARIMHPYTCRIDACRALHPDPLVAHADGWRCRSCAYRQNWADAAMVDVVLIGRELSWHELVYGEGG